MKVYVLTTKINSRLVDGKLHNYPDSLPTYKVMYGPTVHDGDITIPKWYRDAASVKNDRILLPNYCCYLGHINIIKYHYNNYPNESLLLLEDDVVFEPEFDTYYKNFMEMVPDDWDVINFGGRTVFNDSNKNSGYVEVKPNVLKLCNMYGTECILFSPKFVKTLVDYYITGPEIPRHSTDYTIGQWAKEGKINAYRPIYTFAYPKDGFSFIQQKNRSYSNSRNIKYINITGNVVSNSKGDLARYNGTVN